MESEVRFKIKANTKLNQSVKLLGNISELGEWDHNQAIPLYTNERSYPNWKNLHYLRVPFGNHFSNIIFNFFF